MGLDNVKIANKVEIELGGKTWEIRYPVKAFRDLQEKYGGWRKAWALMVGVDKEGLEQFEVNYDVLVDMLVFGIRNSDAGESEVRTWVNDLMQDEVGELVRQILQAKTRWVPEENEKERDVLRHLEDARKGMLGLARDEEATALEEMAASLRDEVSAGAADPQK